MRRASKLNRLKSVVGTLLICLFGFPLVVAGPLLALTDKCDRGDAYEMSRKGTDWVDNDKFIYESRAERQGRRKGIRYIYCIENHGKELINLKWYRKPAKPVYFENFVDPDFSKSEIHPKSHKPKARSRYMIHSGGDTNPETVVSIMELDTLDTGNYSDDDLPALLKSPAKLARHIESVGQLHFISSSTFHIPASEEIRQKIAKHTYNGFKKEDFAIIKLIFDSTLQFTEGKLSIRHVLQYSIESDFKAANIALDSVPIFVRLDDDSIENLLNKEEEIQMGLRVYPLNNILSRYEYNIDMPIHDITTRVVVVDSEGNRLGSMAISYFAPLS